MKAFFVYKDGELIIKPENPIGYTTLSGAKNSLKGCKDWYNLLHRYDKNYMGVDSLTEEQKELGLWKYYEPINTWIFQRELWTKKIWNKYVEEHYQFIEKEFEIVFKD